MNNNEKFEQIYLDILTNKKDLEHSKLNAKIEVILKWITAFSVIFIGLFVYLFLYNKFQNLSKTDDIVDALYDYIHSFGIDVGLLDEEDALPDFEVGDN